jgi:eukaryotic-like serine/threonine-protein kinase
MGEVFEARDLSLGTVVALKMIRRELAGDPAALERLRHEVVLARRVTHPNVCRIFEFFEGPGEAFLTMELIEGETLSERIRRSGPVPPVEALSILRDVAAGLEAIHASGIVHRDVKTGNVLLADRGDRQRRAVVTDFGIALGGPADRLTETGGLVGTPDAMAPEQRSGREVSARTDVYALALLARELVTGQSESAGLERVPPRWRAALTRSLDPDPQRRHGTATELVSALGPRQSRSGRRWATVVGGLLVVVVAAGLIGAQRMAARGSDRRSLAVLPLANLGGDPANAWFSDGLTEDILTALSHVPGLKVISRTSSMAYRDTAKPARQVASELGVGVLLEGSVRRADGRVRITTKLIDAHTDEQLWAETYDRDVKGVLDLQMEVAQQVAVALKLRLGNFAGAKLGLGGTRNPEAYEAYLRGLYAADRWEVAQAPWGSGIIGENLEVAPAEFTRATEIDPGYALAHAQLGYAHLRQVLYEGYPPEVQQQYFKRARMALARAESLEPSLALVQIVRSQLLFSQPGGWDIDGALVSLRRGRSLDPEAGHLEATTLFSHIGLNDQAIREGSLALERDPGSQEARSELVNAYAFAVRYPELLAQRHRLSPPPEIRAFFGLSLLGDAAGRQELRSAHFPQGALLDILLDALDGRTAQAEQALNAYSGQGEERRRYYHHFTFYRAMITAVLGRPEEAVQWLRRTAELGYPNVIAFRDEPRLASLHGHPGYEALLAELEKRRARWAAENP